MWTQALLFVALIVALAALLLSLLRRAPQRAKPSAAASGEAPTASPAPAGSKALGRDEVLRKLHALAFGAEPRGPVPPAQVEIVAAIGSTIESSATDPRYAPRRPLLLPQLLRAASDDGSSRKDLADIIARDPALVGSLLKLANGPYYRTSSKPVESIDRAVTILGTQGIRSLAAAALVQPVFRASSKDSGRFAEVTWEHTYRSAAAAEVFAFAVEGTDPFAAQLLALVTGLARIVVFRVATDQYAARGAKPDPTALASLLDEHGPAVAHEIATTWELSDRMLAALDEQLRGSARPVSDLGRSLRFGVVAGALSVLAAEGVIDEETARASLVAAGGSGKKFERMWERFAAQPAAT
ncbi:MAG TPA: HDOD domain-containing protein [Gammaproteobacteria bacterium]|nr:HDOD domain-containing protein [Gammaproteobacteria bacterium]